MKFEEDSLAKYEEDLESIDLDRELLGTQTSNFKAENDENKQYGDQNNLHDKFLSPEFNVSILQISLS